MKILSLFILILLSISNSWAQNFSAAVSPPRFELATDAGKKVKQTFTLFNVGHKGGQYKVSTNDWRYNHGNLSFSKALLPNSCREWVSLERHKISVPAGKERKFRFEIDVPENAKTKECRFAIMLESVEPAGNQVGSSIQLPVKARLAVIVYLSVNGAKPQLQISDVHTINYQGMKLPVLLVKNTGSAHGRMSGTLKAKAANGKSIDLSVSNSPIMSGDAEKIVLMPSQFGKALEKQSWTYPLNINGKIYWQGGVFSVKKQIAG